MPWEATREGQLAAPVRTAQQGDRDVDVVGGTFVGGSSSGWQITDPSANALSLGFVPAPVYGGGAPLHGGSVGGTATYPSGYDPYGGTGVVGGSWSPEPAGNNQILYGHYSAQGMLAIPQASTGVQTTMVPRALLTSTPAPAPTPARAPAATGGGQARPAPAEPKPAAAEPKPAENPEPPKPRTVKVKPGDNLSRIAAANGTTWQKLYELNKATIGSNPNLIRPGQELKLP